jgi:TolB-like protein
VRYFFGDHQLDTERRELKRGDSPVALEPQVFDLLVCLLQNRNRVLSKNDLLARVWGGRIVSDATIDSRIKAARRAIGDSGAAQGLIRTFARKGVRFIAAVQAEYEGNTALPGSSDAPSKLRLLNDRPSIAVLRFQDLSGDPEQAYFADGMAEEIITALSRIRWLFVIAHNSSFTYTGQREDAKRVGSELGVRYVLEGSVRRAGGRVRITAQLIDATTGACLWANGFGGSLEDVFDLQDKVATSVAGVIEPTVQALRPQDTPALAASISRATVAPRLSIVVLPFTNLSGDPAQQYFADGITEDLTTDLSRLANMLVISRGTAFTYQGKRVDAKQIGRELGVRYVLEGSVRRSGDQIRINAQLIDAESDTHLWAERFDRNTTDLFALQDEITTRIAITLRVELPNAEAARPTEHPDALDYILRARAAGFARPTSLDRTAEVTGLLEHALALDPRSVDAQASLAVWLAGGVLSSTTGSAVADLERAKRLSEQALRASPRSALAHVAKGDVLRVQLRYAEAIPEYEAALALDRNMLFALNGLASCKLSAGSIEETIPLCERAIRLSPRDPHVGYFYNLIGTVHLLQSRTNEAIMWLEKARYAEPELSSVHAALASAYALDGEIERSAAQLTEARGLSSDDRYSSLARLRAHRVHVVPKIRALFEATYDVGLSKAGMPEK